MKKKVLCLALCLGLLTSGCQSAIPVTGSQAVTTLPPASLEHQAPVGDATLEYQGTATLFLPRKDGVRLVAVQEPVTFSAARHGAEAALRALFAYEGNELVNPLGGDVRLSLAGLSPVEVSGDVCTVNLAASVLQLSYSEFYTVCLAIANTLTEFSDIAYVNILVAGKANALDIAGTLPTGSMPRRTGEDLSSQWAQAEVQRVLIGENPTQKRLTSAATLYFPCQGSNGILAEVRSISFEGQSAAQLAGGLVTALSAGTQTLTNVPEMPDLMSLLSQPVTVTETAGEDGRQVNLYFASQLNEELVSKGITRSVLMASLTYTLTTFMPGVVGVQVYIGSELISSIAPSSIYADAAVIEFPSGLQRREDYAAFLLDSATLYFAASNGRSLIGVQRPMPHYQAASPRYLLLQLSHGVQSFDSLQNAVNPIASPLQDADILGFSIYDDTLLVNVSGKLADTIRLCTPEQERLLCYSIVNTLCQNAAVSRIGFYFNGRQEETLAGEIYWAGLFWQNPGILSN